MSDNQTNQLLALITGAAGGVGVHLVTVMRQNGYRVRATDKTAKPEVFNDLDVEWVRQDLTGRMDIDTLVKGCDVVIHAAARVSLTESYDDFVPINIHATRRLYEASCRHNIKHFVHISCGSLYASSKSMLDESSEIDVQTGYTRSKRDAEYVITRAGETSTAWTILRPQMIYGPHCQRMMAGLVTLPPIFRQMIPYLPGMTGGPRTNWCHAEDVALAALFVLQHVDQTNGQIYNVADNTPMGFGEALTSITEAYGLELGPLVPFPGASVQSFASPFIDRDFVFDNLRTTLREIWKRVLAKHELTSPLRPRVDRKALVFTSADLILDTQALRDIGWQPKWPNFKFGIVETVQWYQAKGWVPRYDTQSLVDVRQKTRVRGFAFNEMLSGQWTDVDGDVHEMKLDLDIQFPQVRQLAAKINGTIDGTIWMRGLAAYVPVIGTVGLKWFGRTRKLIYEFAFEGDEDTTYRFYGEKDIDWFHPINSMETLTGDVFDQRGERIAQVELGYKLSRQIVPFLVSLRFMMNSSAFQENL